MGKDDDRAIIDRNSSTGFYQIEKMHNVMRLKLGFLTYTKYADRRMVIKIFVDILKIDVLHEF